MLLVIPEVLSATEVATMRERLEQADWQDGRQTAGYAAIDQKSNLQLQVRDPLAVELGQHILQALSTDPRFISFALPGKILSPMFNCYRGGGEYGFHIDNAIRVDPLGGDRIRTDVSTTLFFSDPGDYDGGELVVSGTYGVETVKLPAGHAVVYPGTSLHRVTPVSRGQRLAAFFWTQSMVQDETQRNLLYELDCTIQQLALRPENRAEVVRLTGVYHNLVRGWAQV